MKPGFCTKLTVEQAKPNLECLQCVYMHVLDKLVRDPWSICHYHVS